MAQQELATRLGDFIATASYLDGGVKSVELASIGRRTAEAEYDLLQLVD